LTVQVSIFRLKYTCARGH